MAVNRNRKVVLQLDDRSFEGLKISFDVTKTVKQSPLNKANIAMHNVAEETFEQLIDRRRDLIVRLLAGYGFPNLIFQGNPVKNGVQFEWSDADRVLQIEAQDGYRAYQKARLNVTLDAANLTMADVAAEAARQLNLPVGIIDIPGNAQLTQGLVLTGSVENVLQRIAASTGTDVSVQNGVLQILPKNKVRRNAGPLYSSKLKNIITYPKFTDEGLKLTVFLDGSLEPGDRFKVAVDSKRYDGVYKALTVKHSGDLWGQTFYTEIEARPLKGDPPAAATELNDLGLITPINDLGLIIPKDDIQSFWPGYDIYRNE